jgi:cation:H+ antiporter
MSIAFGLFGGLVLLILGGDALVRGAVALALRLGIPALIVSLTIVGFGTSAPELVVSLQAALEGAPAIAIGNVVGSNIANVLLILGLPALLVGLGSANGDTRASFWMMMAATALFGGLAWSGSIGRLGGALLFAGLAAMLLHSLHSVRKARTAPVENPHAASVRPAVIGVLLLAGLVGLPLGAHLFIDAAVQIARAFEIPEETIGLTLVAVGTSLPELATTVMAALRRNADVAIGNVIGSNIFNLLGILGVTALVVPLPVPPQIMASDFWIMAASSALLLPMVFFGLRLTRPMGAGLTALYGGYTLWLLA